MIEDLGRLFNFQILGRGNHELFFVQVAGASKYEDDFVQAVSEEKTIETLRSGYTLMQR